MRNLNLFDAFVVLFSWSGAAAIAYFTRDSDGIIALLALAAAYYLAKRVILRGREEL
jgi:hypothetical protein